MKYILNKEILIITFGQITGLIGSFIFIKLISQTTSVGEYGLYSLALSTISLIALIPFSSFDQAIGRFLSDYNIDIYFSHVFIIYGIAIIMVGSILIIFFSYVQLDILSVLNPIMFEILVFALLNIIRNFLLNLENFRRNRLVVASSKIFEVIFKVSLIYITSYFLNIDAIVIINVVNIIFFLNILYLLINNKNSFSKELLQLSLFQEIFNKIFIFSTPLLMWTLFSWFTLNAPLWILQTNFNQEIVGYFSMINNLGMLFPIQLIAVLSAYFSPIYYQNETTTVGYTKKSVTNIMKLLIFILLIFGIFLYSFSNEFILLVSSEKYLEYGWIIIFLYFNYSISSLGQFLSIEIFVYKETKYLIVANIVPAIVMFFGVFIVPYYGIIGLLIVMILSSISYLGIITLQVRRIRNIKFKEFQ